MLYKTYTFIFPRGLNQNEENIFIGCIKSKRDDITSWFYERINRLESGKQGRAIDAAGQGARAEKEKVLAYLKLAVTKIKLNKLEEGKYLFAFPDIPEDVKKVFTLDVNLRTDDVIIRTGFSLGDVAIRYKDEELD